MASPFPQHTAGTTLLSGMIPQVPPQRPSTSCAVVVERGPRTAGVV